LDALAVTTTLTSARGVAANRGSGLAVFNLDNFIASFRKDIDS
jgi:hypothetical protein